MKVEKIDVLDINILSKLLEDYIKEVPEVANLYDYSKNIGEFKRVFENKSKENINREVLVRELTAQYEAIEDKDKVIVNIKSLANEKTFTVTTAHQLCLFTGPLYFIYKSISVIKLASILKENYPDFNFVPIFWLGSEDHDFEEVNHLNIYDKKIEWESGQRGAVGRMKNINISKAISDVSKILFNGQKNELVNIFNKYFKEEDNYVESFIKYLHHLFGKYGLVVLDQDNASYKELFNSVIKDELFNSLVEKSIQKEYNYLNENYKTQANPRSINIFYMIDGLRERIEKKDNEYFVLNSDISFTEKTLLEELKNHPERFSPNVLLRPLYQESILPNLAYVGGGGELAYWLQLRGLFHSQQRKMPMLLLRDMALIIDPKSAENIDKIQLDKKCLFLSNELIISDLVKKSSSNNLSLKSELNTLEKMYKSVLDSAVNIDKTLEQHVLAQQKLMQNSMLKIEQKMLRAEKKNQSVLVGKIDALKSSLFPSGALQERHTNFLPYYKKYDSSFFDLLIENFDPLSAQVKLIFEDE